MFYPEDAKLDCEGVGRQINRVWQRLASTEVNVRGESPLALARKSERPRLESLQKRYNVLLQMAHEKQCQEWDNYGLMVVGESEGTERVGREARQNRATK